jgi:hypothetical protein
MKHLSYLVPNLPRPATQYAKECLAKIAAILARAPEPEKVAERIVGADDEEIPE